MNQSPEILNTRQREILQIILERSLHDPETTAIPKFRLEFLKDREIIDHFTHSQLIRKNDNQTRYTPSLVGMYLTNSDLSNQIFKDIDRICEVLRSHYKQQFDAPVLIDNIGSAVSLDKKYLVFCLEMLCDGASMGRTTDMMSDGAEIIPSEQLFDFKHYSDIPESYLPSWFPDKFKSETKKPGVTEANASKREEILGAAVAVIANFPDQCMWGEKISGKRVYELINDKSPLWWDSGEPPLKDEAAIKLINKWLKTL